jgi:hypothetical protein
VHHKINYNHLTMAEVGNIPQSFVCPLTHEIMLDPVVDPEGNTYERAAIEDWLAQNASSPVTRSPLQISQLAPNRVLKEIIDEFRLKLTIANPRNTPVVVDALGDSLHALTSLRDGVSSLATMLKQEQLESFVHLHAEILQDIEAIEAAVGNHQREAAEAMRRLVQHDVPAFGRLLRAGTDSATRELKDKYEALSSKVGKLIQENATITEQYRRLHEKLNSWEAEYSKRVASARTWRNIKVAVGTVLAIGIVVLAASPAAPVLAGIVWGVEGAWSVGGLVGLAATGGCAAVAYKKTKDDDAIRLLEGFKQPFEDATRVCDENVTELEAQTAALTALQNQAEAAEAEAAGAGAGAPPSGEYAEAGRAAPARAALSIVFFAHSRAGMCACLSIQEVSVLRAWRTSSGWTARPGSA